MDVRDAVTMLEDADREFLLLEPRSVFDGALVGYVERCGQERIACYDYNAVIRALMDSEGMPEESALEWFEYNILGAWVGERTPCFLFRPDLDHD